MTWQLLLFLLALAFICPLQIFKIFLIILKKNPRVSSFFSVTFLSHNVLIGKKDEPDLVSQY